MRQLGIAALTILSTIATAAAEPPARLTRIPDRNEKGELRADATMGQNTVAYYLELQAEHPESLAFMNDAFACKLGPTEFVKAAASRRARRLPADVRSKLAAKDQTALESLSIDVVAELDGVDAAKIRADEALGPGVYRPAITSVAYTISRCKFYR